MIQFYYQTTDFEDFDTLNDTENYREEFNVEDENSNKIKVNVIYRRIKRKMLLKSCSTLSEKKYRDDYLYLEVLLFDENKRFFKNTKFDKFFENIYDTDKQKLKIYSIDYWKNNQEDEEEYTYIKINNNIILNEFESDLNLKYFEEMIDDEETNDDKKNELLNKKQIISTLYPSHSL